jgi:hypothetical protein
LRNASRLRLVGATIALAAVSVAGVAGSASADPAPKQGGPVAGTFKFKGNEETMRLVGPATIRQGQNLAIKNETRPSAVGPHTFTLGKPSEFPKGKKQQKKCANLRTPFCAAVAFEWHQFEPPNTINQPLSDVNEPGWDTPGDRNVIGDSWFTGQRGDRFVAQVSSAPRTLRYICIVHPNLKGRLEVKPAPAP